MIRSIVAIAAFALLFADSSAAETVFSDDFAAPPLTGWTVINRSDPVGDVGWRHGPFYSGLRSRTDGNDFATVSYESAGSGTGAISSCWLISPIVELANGQTLSFDTIGQDGEGFPNRLQVRLNITNSSTEVGTTATSVGDFTTLLLDLNPTYRDPPDPQAYPDTWTNYALPISGLPGPVSGRFAFRYFVEDSGPLGSRGTEIGVDNVILSSVPEPAGVAVLVAPAMVLCARRRKRQL